MSKHAKLDPVAEAQAEVERTERAVVEASAAVEVAAGKLGMDARVVRALQPLSGNEAERIADARLDARQRQELQLRVAFHDADRAHAQARVKNSAACDALEAAQKVAYLAALGDGRGALADAIKAYDAAVASGGIARQVVEKARGALVAAQTRHSTAESALAEARERAIGAVTGDPAQGPELKTLRRDVADAADDVEIAAAALARAETATSEPDYAERKAREAVEIAADTVLSMGFDAAYAEAQVQAERFAKTAWLAHALGDATPGSSGEAYRRRGRVEVMNPHMVVQGGKGQAIADEARAEVAAARAALLLNPQAKLPSLT